MALDFFSSAMKFFSVFYPFVFQLIRLFLTRKKHIHLFEHLHHPVKNPVHISQRHAVVANRDALVHKKVRSVEQLLARAHAAATLDGHGIFFGMLDGRQTRHILEMDVFSCVFQDHAGQLHATDVLAGAVVGGFIARRMMKKHFERIGLAQ